jgi:Ca2+:H+ antiporter
MPPTETSPLLNGHPAPSSRFQRFVSFVKGKDDEPSWSDSLKFLLFGTYLNVLLVFVPLSAFAHYLNWDAALRFTFSFLAVVPLAKVRFSTMACFALPRSQLALASR